MTSLFVRMVLCEQDVNERNRKGVCVGRWGGEGERTMANFYLSLHG